jgi:hypothetical protein
VAAQIAAENFALFAAIHPLEYIGHLWPKLGLETAHLDAFAARFNWLVRWTKSSVLLHKTDEKRRRHNLKHLIRVATACLDLQDFSGAFALVSGLASAEVSRLKKVCFGSWPRACGSLLGDGAQPVPVRSLARRFPSPLISRPGARSRPV